MSYLQVGAVTGELNSFIIEPFIAHEAVCFRFLINNTLAISTPSLQSDEYYICIYSQRDEDVILFHHEGGVDIGDVDAKVLYRTSLTNTPILPFLLIFHVP